MGWELVTVEVLWVLAEKPWRLCKRESVCPNASISQLAMQLSTNVGAATSAGLHSYFQDV